MLKKLESNKLITRIAYNLFPCYLWVSLAYEMRVTMIRLGSRNVPRRYRQATELLINLGAGNSGVPGWVNVDIFKAPGINCLYDCRNHMPFPDESAKAIFSEHFLEHLDYVEESPHFLSECKRVLKNKGVLRIIVPDAQAYLRGYCYEGWDDLIHLRSLTTEKRDPFIGTKYNTKMELINEVFRQNGEHKYAYDFETLSSLLYKHGFSSVFKQEFGKSLMPELCIDARMRANESLYVEAVK